MTRSNNIHEKTTLTDFLKENTRSIIDPMVAVLARMGVTPNMLTYTGMLIHVPIAWLLMRGQFVYAAILGILSMFDALDGALARMLNNGNPVEGYGGFLDSTLDRISEILLFGGLLFYFTEADQTPFVMVAYLAVAGSIMVSYTRSRAEALGYSCKIGLFTRVERYMVLFFFGLFSQPELAVVVLAIGTWYTVLQRSLHVWQQSR